MLVFLAFQRISSCDFIKERVKMINFNNRKTKKTIAAVIVIILVIAMVVPLILF